MKKLMLAALAAASLVTSVSASAATLLFEYTALNSKTAEPNLSFKLTDTPTPVAFNTTSFTLLGVYAKVCTNQGCTAQSGPVSFYTVEGGGIMSGFNFDLYGDKVFKGDTSTPFVVTGSFAAYDNFDLATQIGTFVITDVTGVPEAATWAMMIAGFGFAGAAARRRRNVAVTA